MEIASYFPAILCAVSAALRLVYAMGESRKDNYVRATYEMAWVIAHLICLFGYIVTILCAEV